MARLSRAYARLLEGFGLLAGLTIAVLAVLMSVDIAIRNIGIGSLPWIVEVSEYALFVSTFLAAPWVLRLGAHVRVDLVLNIVPAGVSRVMEIVVDAAGVVISGVLGWYGLAATVDSFRLGGIIVKQLAVPEWPLLAVIPLSALLLVIEFLLRLSRTAQGGALPSQDAALRDGL